MSNRKGLEYLCSDHAVIRWLERVEGLNIEAVRQHILNHQVMAEIATQDRRTVQEATVTHEDGVNIVVRCARVVTVLCPSREKAA